MGKIKREVELSHIKAVEVKDLPNLINDPFVLKKREQAIAFILKNGLPKRFEKEYQAIKKEAVS
jgi:hypothetical protein